MAALMEAEDTIVIMGPQMPCKSIAQIVPQPHIRCILTLLMAHPCGRIGKPHIFPLKVEGSTQPGASVEQKHQ